MDEPTPTSQPPSPSAPVDAPARPLRTGLSLLTPLLWIVGLLVLLLALLAGGARWVVATEAGSWWLLQRLPMVQLKGFKGALLGDRWRADSLRVEWAGGQQWLLIEGLVADGLRWQWRPSAHAWVAVKADLLTARKLTLHTGPPSKEAPQLPANLAPPVALQLAEVRIDDIQVEGQAALQKLALRGLQIDPSPGAGHQAERFSFEGYTLAVDGALRIANTSPYALAATANLRPLADGDAPRWTAAVKAAGTVPELDVTATLRGRALAGREAPEVDLRAGLRPLLPWPLASLDARTQALDLSALAAKAPATKLTGQAVLTGGAGDTPLTVQVELSNALPGRWNEGRLPVTKLAFEVKGQRSQPDLVEMSRFELALADATRSAGNVTGTAVWKGHDVAFEMQLKGITPQRLDGRAAAMTLAGPVAASITGVPALVPQPGGQPAPGAAWTMDLQGKLDAAPLPVRLQLEGKANDHELDIQRARAQSGSAVAELTAKVARAGSSDWRVITSGQLRDFDPLPWWPGDAASAWRKGPHRLSGDWQFDVRLPGDADTLPPLTLAQRVAGNGKLAVHDSQLAGVPLKADITLGYNAAPGAPPATLRADFNLGGNLLAIEGLGDPASAGANAGNNDRWRIELKADSLVSLAPLVRLQPAWAEWAPRQGSATAALSANGRWPQMTSEGNVRLSQLQAGPLQVARGTLGWQLSTAAEQAQSLQFDMAGVVWDKQRVDNVRAELRGTQADHRIDISGAMAVLPPAVLERVFGIQGQSGTRAQLQAQGSWVADNAGGGTYRTAVERLIVGSWDGSPANAPPASGWAESRDIKAELQFAGGKFVALQADAGHLRVADALGLKWDEVRLDLRGSQPQIQLRADIEAFALAPLLARAQPGFGWQGDLKLGAHIDIRAADKMDAEVVFERRSGDLQLASADGVQALGLSELRLAVSAHDGLWNFTPVLRGSRIGEISGRIKAQSAPERRWPEGAAPIDGSVTLQVADIGIWSAWVPAGWRLGGAVKGTAAVSGTFGEPLFTGSLGASGLAVRNLLQGVNISDGQVAVKLDGETATVERFTLRGGDGTATVTGGAKLGRSPQAKLQLVAERFRLLGRVDRLVTASGKLDITLQQERAQVDGKIKLDEMLFDASRSDAPSLDDDVTVRRPGSPDDQPADANGGKSKFDLALGVDIDLGDKARFKGWGIDTGLNGQLRLTSPGGRPAVIGTISTENGTFANYGQKLIIERGIVAFSGPLGNPRLDVLALRPNVENMRVGVTLTGNLLTMRIRLYSEPELSENDKLAWLMLGRAPDSLGRNETALLQRAAVALLSGDGEAPTDALMKALGIDDVSLRSSDTDVRETVVSIGKQLSRRWYLGYERGVNATTGTWQLIYRIAQRFTLRMQSGMENALDIIWTWRFQETPADAGMRKSTLTPP